MRSRPAILPPMAETWRNSQRLADMLQRHHGPSRQHLKGRVQHNRKLKKITSRQSAGKSREAGIRHSELEKLAAARLLWHHATNRWQRVLLDAHHPSQEHVIAHTIREHKFTHQLSPVLRSYLKRRGHSIEKMGESPNP